VSLIYRKTVKGNDAISNRSRELAGRLRSLLILVDGKRAQTDLGQLASGFGDVDAMLGLLAQGGFIEPVAEPALAVGAQGAAPAAGVAAPAAPPTLAQAKKMATRLLVEMMGPNNSQSLCLRIESAKNLPEYVDAVKRAYTVVRESGGVAQAERFGAALEANLPRA